MAATTEYAKTVDTYNALAKKAKGGDIVAREEKAKAMADIRAIEREAAREGKILRRAGSALPGDGANKRRVITQSGLVGETASKRSLQEEYCRKFDDKRPVDLGDGKPITLREYHTRRLLKRGA